MTKREMKEALNAAGVSDEMIVQIKRTSSIVGARIQTNIGHRVRATEADIRIPSALTVDVPRALRDLGLNVEFAGFWGSSPQLNVYRVTT